MQERVLLILLIFNFLPFTLPSESWIVQCTMYTMKDSRYSNSKFELVILQIWQILQYFHEDEPGFHRVIYKQGPSSFCCSRLFIQHPGSKPTFLSIYWLLNDEILKYFSLPERLLWLNQNDQDMLAYDWTQLKQCRVVVLCREADASNILVTDYLRVWAFWWLESISIFTWYLGLQLVEKITKLNKLKGKKEERT